MTEPLNSQQLACCADALRQTANSSVTANDLATAIFPIFLTSGSSVQGELLLILCHVEEQRNRTVDDNDERFPTNGSIEAELIYHLGQSLDSH